ncbi:MAG: hypothetical protein C0432_03720 [Candidatus Puniceispirillum sp.]|nr:hypothetical protein [Candidatus Pelagibacter sp.]MBA4283383.1 hypothetical protein [Candidatus Puniceispirillum sp.]
MKSIEFNLKKKSSTKLFRKLLVRLQYSIKNISKLIFNHTLNLIIIILFINFSYSYILATETTQNTSEVVENSVTFSAATVEPSPPSTMESINEDVLELKRRMDEADQVITSQKKTIDSLNTDIITINSNIDSLKVLKQNSPTQQQNIQTTVPSTASNNALPMPAVNTLQQQPNSNTFPQQQGFCPCMQKQQAPQYPLPPRQSNLYPLDDENYAYNDYPVNPNNGYMNNSNSDPATQNIYPNPTNNVISNPSTNPTSPTPLDLNNNNTDFMNTGQNNRNYTENTDYNQTASPQPSTFQNNTTYQNGQSGFGANYAPPPPSPVTPINNIIPIENTAPNTQISTLQTPAPVTPVNTIPNPPVNPIPEAVVTPPPQTASSVVGNLIGGLFSGESSTETTSGTNSTNNTTTENSTPTPPTTATGLVGSLVSGLLGG